ncbi:endo alpha-1,4 polygalactosaminidase [Plantactinospora sp. S1510]|uniref:Endo alpha-1,4 polygalactosaminidase n=1 Tax=Plantactinospora alkalitolerans TaxID=2789879 RepID=A0ABS0H7I7_9ACTN|nr:endo alpha-1,4 polygalactosaminidase [Plantactinospora alkalitolerans]MBF9134109.1 endo alpha-1,4 polygalactosaminidase [Plantactinospora alkalitolerans]
MPRNRATGLLLAVGLLLLLPGCRLLPNRSAPVPPWPGSPAPSWQWQLSGPLDPTVDAELYALDVFRTSLEEARRLRTDGRRLICSVEVGIHQESRPDATRFPAAVLGRPAGIPGQPKGAPRGRWLDIRQWSTLEPVLADRFRLCRGKGFVAVLPVGMESYTRRTGFPLTFDDQLIFNRHVAELARQTQLAPGLTNDIDQVLALEPYFDFVVNEECFRRTECDRLMPFVDAGKPVLHVEYEGSTVDFCTATVGYGFSSIRKNRNLDVRRDPCPR